MEWLRELQNILGGRVRFETERMGKAFRPKDFRSDEARRFLHDQEEWIPVEGGYVVIDRARLPAETVRLVRLLVKTGTGCLQAPHTDWFGWLIRTRRDRNGDRFVSRALERRWHIPLPGLVAILQLHAEDAQAAFIMLEEMLSEREWAGQIEEQGRRIWLYLPLRAGESVDDVKEIGGRLLDTLLTELYASGKLAVSQPADSLPELPSAVRQAEIALRAGSSFRNDQSIYLYGRLGLARLLSGVSDEAKSAFLQEVLPEETYGALTQELRETVRSFAQHGQNIAETARALYIHRNTLLYRLDKIQEVTGKDIRRFEELAELWLALILRSGEAVQKSGRDFV